MTTKIVLADSLIGADEQKLVGLAAQLDSGPANPVEGLVLPAIQEDSAGQLSQKAKVIYVKLSNVSSDNNKLTVIPLSEKVNIAPLHPRRTGANSAAHRQCHVQYDTGADRTIVDQRFLSEVKGYYKSKGRLTNTKIVLADGSVGADDPELVELAVQLDSSHTNPVEALVLPSIQELPQLTADTPQTWRAEIGDTIISGGRVDPLIGCDSSLPTRHRDGARN